jgi:hypothetical protein
MISPPPPVGHRRSNFADDRLSEVPRKCEEYGTWGVPNIWVIESEMRKLYVYTAGFSEVDRFELPEFGFSVTAASLFSAAIGQ